MGTSDDEHGRVSWTTPGDLERPIEMEQGLGLGDWPHGGCPDCNGLEMDCMRCQGTGYLPESGS